ncbi:bifunctional diguanylate cyclase/phosphodiesterase [uncultured Roseobacter sp.]|uniref:putative bifunctional diguanylate cyclase/phosphodiesterase n=1 Tax=uncultured Roseobacter sp. TaxID=114847 RepID=UPI00261977FC|nr:bifunctional diguanylate cyclase/phosphodiesterase [uncultured Roseobacter sp.]
MIERTLIWRYTLRYMCAMMLVAGAIALGAFQVNKVLELNRQQSEVISIASDQPLLAQRLVLLPDRVATETNSYSKGRVLVAIRETVDDMRAGHDFLLNGRPDVAPPAQMTEALMDHYARDRRHLNREVSDFLDFYESFLEDPDMSRQIVAMERVQAENFLLVALEHAAFLHAAAAEAEMMRAIKIHGIWVAISLALVVLVGVFIFRPLTRDAAKAVAKISAQLDERANLLSQSLKISRMGHWRAINPEADPIWLSKELIELWGMEVQEGFHPLSLVQAGDVVKEDEDVENNAQHLAFKRVLETGEPAVSRSQFRRPNGEIIDMLVHMEAERDDNGQITGVVGVIQDNTAQATADRALKDSYRVIERKSADLMEAQRLGNLATWRFCLDGERVELDERAYEIMKLDANTFEPTLENIRSFYMEESRRRLEALQQSVIETGAQKSDTLKLRRADGSVIDLHIRTKLERDEAGAPFALFGTLQDVTKERRAARELEKLAYYDNLTGLANRTLFSRELKRVCAAASGDDPQAALLLIDLDHFKEVNDTLGHQAGDQLLGIVGHRLSKVVPNTAFVARLGGDEFAIVVEGGVTRQELDQLGNAIVESMSVPASLSLGSVQTNASIGIAVVPVDSSEPDELLRFADLALYASKEQGRGRHSYYDASLSVALGTRMNLSAEIRSALDEKRFEAHYQAIVDSETGTVNGFEALLRLPKNDGGFIPPSEFIPIAESSHLIADLGSFVLHAACAEAQRWVAQGLPRRTVSVNVSAAQVWHGDLEKVIDSALRSSGLDPHLLCIELTETVFAAENIGRLEGILNRLKARGVQLALDDFGTGYSSLGYLNRLPFDKLKIDRMFVSNAHLSTEKQKMLCGVVSLAKGLDLKVTAEGVETEEEWQLVRDLGCDDVQGWLFSVALPGPDAVLEADHIDATCNPPPLTLRDADLLRSG